MNNYKDPITKQPLSLSADGTAICGAGGKPSYPAIDGCFDFVADKDSGAEREFYDGLHEEGWDGSGPLDGINLESLWTEEPGCTELLESLGEVKGRKILLVGNGTSIREFLLIARGAQCTYTDLSFTAVRKARGRFLSSKLAIEHKDHCEFHAVNAAFLPYEDNTFDIIYANAVVHHMDDLNGFFAEVYRCLKPGGICRFLDTAVSPFWQTAKRTVLRPIQIYSHKKHGISPEDVRATAKGGYTRDEMDKVRNAFGFKGMVFRRVTLFDYLLWRARCKLKIKSLLALRPMIRGLDSLLSKRTSIMEKQGVSLVFGFTK